MVATPATQYIVASTPRTGSSLLCEGLSATGVAGFPNEPFAPDFRWMWREAWGLEESVSAREYVDCALRHATSPNGVVAFKIQWMHVPVLAHDLGLREADVLSELLTRARFVNIVRRDRRAQALSWFRAIATDQWWRFEEPAAPAPAAPDPAAVSELEGHIDAQQAAWRRYFADHAVDALTVEYEALARDYRREIARVLAFLGLDPARAQSIPAPRLRRQADATTVTWRRGLEPVIDRSL